MKRRPLFSIIQIFLTCGFTSHAGASDATAALELLKEQLRCPIATVKYRQGTSYSDLLTKNRFAGSIGQFLATEYFTLTEGSTTGENYKTVGERRVSAKMSQLKARASGSKVTISCKSGGACLTISYKQEGGHDPDWENFTTKKVSYRFTTCSATAASDIQDAVNFLGSGR